MNSTAKRSFILVGIISLALSAAAYGQLGPIEPESSKRIEIGLKPTDFGEQFNSLGLALKEAKNGVETFAVRVAADLPDRTPLEVIIVTARGNFSIGVIEMVLGSGLLELKSTDDPSEAFPLQHIQGVVVTLRGEKLVAGQFAE